MTTNSRARGARPGASPRSVSISHRIITTATVKHGHRLGRSLRAGARSHSYQRNQLPTAPDHKSRDQKDKEARGEQFATGIRSWRKVKPIVRFARCASAARTIQFENVPDHRPLSSNADCGIGHSLSMATNLDPRLKGACTIERTVPLRPGPQPKLSARLSSHDNCDRSENPGSSTQSAHLRRPPPSTEPSTRAVAAVLTLHGQTAPNWLGEWERDARRRGYGVGFRSSGSGGRPSSGWPAKAAPVVGRAIEFRRGNGRSVGLRSIPASGGEADLQASPGNGRTPPS
jgi:hypothetical protein